VRLRGLGRLRKLVRRVGREIAPPAVVLTYHRVQRLESDPWTLAVTPEHFDEQMEVLRRHYHVTSLRELTEARRRGRLPRRAAVVTLDDGYADNLLAAKPLLEKHGVPAPVFVTTGYVDGGREFWWDELERIFLQPGRLPEELRLRIKGETYRWDLRDALVYSPAADDRRWQPGQEVRPGPRQQLYHELWTLMHPLAEEERLDVRAALLAWAGADGLARPTHRTLSGEELTALANGGLVDVGAHTVTHPVLAALPPSAQRDEVRQSKRHLEEILNRQVATFAYPYGRPDDYTEATVEVVKEAGFVCACTTSGGLVGRGADAYRLPRVHGQDVGGEAFARHLDAWFRREE
jgi:peptidoglycan/xylan/chitin deacetylase (PgdA/CDA1 family)